MAEQYDTPSGNPPTSPAEFALETLARARSGSVGPGVSKRSIHRSERRHDADASHVHRLWRQWNLTRGNNE